MNRSTIPNLPKRVLALVLAAALLTPSALASAGTAQINTAQTLADGLVYRNTVSNHSSAGRMESFALELEPDSEVYPIMIQAAGTVYGAATINRAIRTAEELKKSIGCVKERPEVSYEEVKGRCLMTGLPRTITLNSDEMVEALAEPTMEQLKAAGLDLTEEQADQIYLYAIKGAKVLEAFRSQSANRQPDPSGDDVQAAPQQPDGD